MRAILASIGEAVYDWNLITDEIVWSANAAEVLGLPLSAMMTGAAFRGAFGLADAAQRDELIRGASAADAGRGVRYRLQCEMSGAGGRRVEDSGRWFAGPDARPARAHGVMRVIAAEAPRERAGPGDPHTGVADRHQLFERLRALCPESGGPTRPFTLLLVSIENLLLINRHYGYDVADALIGAVVQRLRESIRGADTIGRYSGNKFALILDGCDAELMPTAAQRFIDVVCREPFQAGASALSVAIRVGGVAAGAGGRSAHLLLQRASEALDLAKQRKEARFVAYSQSALLEDQRFRTMTVSDEIVSALNQRRVAIAYQPIVAAVSGEVRFYEGLVRLRREDGSMMPPSAILPIAEKVGLITLIDQRVLELAIERLVADPTMRLSINMSMATARDPDWPGRAEAALALAPHVASRLTIEITETCAIEDIVATRRIIAALKRLGLTIAMDDFGSGHTSFRNLRDLGVDMIKIDGAFIQNLALSADDRFFVRTLVDLARFLAIPIVAEWVEDADSARLLAEWGVDYLQGHYYGAASDVAPEPAATLGRRIA